MKATYLATETVAAPLPAPSAPESVGWLLLTAAALVAAVGALWRFLPARKEPTTHLAPDPLTVRPAEQYATAAELAEIRADILRLEEGIQKLRDDFHRDHLSEDAQIDAKFARVHARLDACQKETLELIRTFCARK